MKMTIGANIKALRNQKNITQEQLSVAMNVTCAAVSKWERGETYPDITLLQPLAYYFGVTLDDLMGYNHEKVKTEIEQVIASYRKNWITDPEEARKIIVKAYREYPNDYWVMHYYMWNIGGEMSDNDPSVLLKNKEEFSKICERILEGCTEETIRLNAWNMRAKILYAEGNVEEALDIYKSKYTNWYHTCGQKCEQLYKKGSDEYYAWVEKNMRELIAFAATKFARVIFYNKFTGLNEKLERGLKYADCMLKMYEDTKEDFFGGLAYSFITRMENDLRYLDNEDTGVSYFKERREKLLHVLGFVPAQDNR